MAPLLKELCGLFENCTVYELGGHIHDNVNELDILLKEAKLWVNYTWMRPRYSTFKGFSQKGAFEQCVLNCGKKCAADFMLEHQLTEYYNITLEYPWLQCVVGIANEDASIVVNPIELLHVPPLNTILNLS